ncbi:neuralized-like protein 2 [Engraulis encrasicolus]|uniref:neuralized-like protein 2 n=1 Tax=Engraulis encrasicolus TaxID=184585 RepID=UPI002FD6C546
MATDVLLGEFLEFHPIHGTNVQLDPTGTRATRVESFANGVCFSRHPLGPGEIFLVEIEEKELGWCGHLRVGLTAHNPSSLQTVPEYSIPDLVDLGNSWVFAITRSHNKVIEEQQPAAPAPADDLAGGHRLGRGEAEQAPPPAAPQPPAADPPHNRPKMFFSSPHLCIDKDVYIPMDKLIGRSRPGRYSHILDDLYKMNALPPTARRSRIGVLYVPKAPGLADMHIIINGEDMGASAKGISMEQPLYAVVDVFAATKVVRIVQVEYGFASLQTLCRKAIQKNIVHRMALDWLELPERLKNFCKFE